MLSKKWSTVLERKCIQMMCDAIRLLEHDVVRTMSMNSSDDDDTFFYSYNGTEQEHNNDCDLSLLSSSSSSSSSSLSSSSSSSSSLSSISDDSMSDERIEELLVMMQQQHQRILVNIHDPNIKWGRQLRLHDISNSECMIIFSICSECSGPSCGFIWKVIWNPFIAPTDTQCAMRLVC